MSSQVRHEEPTVPRPQSSPMLDHRQAAGYLPMPMASNVMSSSGQDFSSQTTPSQRTAGGSAAAPPEKRRRVDSISKATAPDDKSQGTGSSKERSSRACLNCRKHKMKCENADDPPCKRCRAGGRTCVFQQRANAAWGVDNSTWAEIVEVRLRDLESEMKRLKAMNTGVQGSAAASSSDGLMHASERPSSGHRGIDDIKQSERSSSTDSMLPDVEWRREMSADPVSGNAMAEPSSATSESRTRRQRMPKLYETVTSMKGLALSCSASGMWSDDVVEELWNFFEQHLHTVYPRVPYPLSMDALSPLLLLCLLHAASYHHPIDNMALLAPTYASHLGQLMAGCADPTRLYQNTAADGQLDVPATYESVVGLLIVCQTLLGSSRCVPQWIAVSLRWLLDAYGNDISVVEADWKSLWEWAYQLDVYSSGILLRPSIITSQPPSPPFLHQSPTSFPSPDDVLLTINSNGYRHFAGRGLVSVLDVVWSGTTTLPVHSSSLDKRDEQVKLDWLAELARWRGRYSEAGYELSYRLHRVLVMATGFMTPNYQDLDTLASEAKTALNVFSSGSFRPGSWEMIMITFSARMVLHLMPKLLPADEDLTLLERTASLLQQPAPGLRATQHQIALATSLREHMANVRQGPSETSGSSAMTLNENATRSGSMSIPIISMPTAAFGTPLEHAQRPRSMTNVTPGDPFGIPTPFLRATYPPDQRVPDMNPGEDFDTSTFWQGAGNSRVMPMSEVTPYLAPREPSQWQTAMKTTPRSAPSMDASISSDLHNNPYIPSTSTTAHRDSNSRSNVFDEPPTLLQGQESWPPAFLSWLANDASQWNSGSSV